MPPTPKSPQALGPTAEKGKSAEQRELDAIWRQINDKVIELHKVARDVGGDPHEIRPALNADDVIRYLDEMNAAERKKSEKFAPFRKIVGKTLQCIETVGGIVADGVSDVFAPAGMCYNALTFVIQAWRGYEGMFENLGELLEKCIEFLERLEYYKRTMDTKLTRLACQNLQLFVEICDRLIRLRQKRHKFLEFTKQLFLNDNGVSGLLAMMERLNDKETLLVNAQTYKIVSDSAGDIKLILDSQREQKKEDDAKKWRKIIAKALGFPSSALGNDDEPIPTWQRAFDARKNNLVDGTGSWILEQDAFLDWTKSTEPQKSILVLEGRSGSGKTSMMANVVRSLRMMDQGGPTSRTVTAYFFPEAEKRKPDEDETGGFLETVSRTLLWQISTSYEVMTKSVATIAERGLDFHDAVDRWQQLLLDNKELAKSDTTFFVFIDGVDAEIQKIMPLLKKFEALLGKEKLRILLTANPSTAKEWLHKGAGVDCNLISIPEHNDDDIVKYIHHRMDSMSILRDTSRPGILEWRARIMEVLRLKCAGDYFKLNTSLDALAKVDLVEDIETVLVDADKTRADQIDAEIRRLNNVRTLKEIQEINEIILWIENGKNWFTVEMMEAILSVKYRIGRVGPLPVNAMLSANQGRPTTLTISLLPFAQKLLEKYSLFTITDSSKVDWRSSEIKDRIPFKAVGQAAVPSTGPQVIQENEINIVRHFLHNVCPRELYHRFGFEPFFERKIGARHKEYICLDPDNAQIKIALTCLRILTDEEIRNKPSLRQYAAYWLLEHLQAVDLSAADREIKSQVGPLLVRLFTDQCGIDSMFWPFDLNVSMKTWIDGEHKFLAEARCEWLYSIEGVQEVLRWFKDSSVVKSIDANKSFVTGLLKPGVNLHEAILLHAAKHMADHLFRRVEFLPRQFLAACCFLRAFLARRDPERSSGMENAAEAYRKNSAIIAGFDNKNFTLGELNEIEDWASTVLNRSEDDAVKQSSWEIHGALIIFQLCKEDGATQKYQERARNALKLDSANWHACHFISKQPNTSVREAVELLTRTKQEIDKMRSQDDTWLKSTANSALLARITQELGDRLWEEGRDYAEAARVHRESLQYNYAHFKDYAVLLDRYRDRGAWAEFIAFVEALTQSSKIWAEYLDELVKEFLAHPSIEVGGILAQSADITKRWDIIEGFFTTAIDLATAKNAHDIVFILRDAFAATLASAEDDMHQEEAVSLREVALRDIRQHPSDTMPRAKIDMTIESLAQAYLDRAFRPNTSEEKLESYGSRLADLIPDFEGLDVWISIVPACSLIRYHHKRANESKTARDWVDRIVREAIELLSDDDEGNDDTAYALLARLLATKGDVENSEILWALRNKLQHQAETEWKVWLKAQSTTPRTGTDQSLKRTDSKSDEKTVIAPQVAANGNGKIQPGTRPRNGGLHVNTKRSPSSSSADSDDLSKGPLEPQPFVICAGCDKEWIVVDCPIFTCADCVGYVQLCQDCYERLMKGELKRKGLTCKNNHQLISLPKFEPCLVEEMPRDCVPLPERTEKDKRWMSMVDWKEQLKQLYLYSEKKKTAA